MKGDRRAAARLISFVEDEEPGYEEIMKFIYSKTKGSMITGITGAQGVGKSTIVSLMAREFRKAGEKVGIVAVDPTSPITGGAILGDRIRMPELSDDPDVFIRSMGSRGGSGGLSLQAANVARILDVMGCGQLIIETVGAGQTQVDIMGVADTVVVVTMPGSGDEVQSIKAGLLEIADIYLVNKMDLPGAMAMAEQLTSMLELVEHWEGWKPPVLLTGATSGKGVQMLMQKLKEHQQYLLSNGERERRRLRQMKKEIYSLLYRQVERRISEKISEEEIDWMVRSALDRKISPFEAAEKLASVL